MDKLRTLVQTLSQEEAKAFEAFAKRLQQRGNRKDLSLFRVLRREQAIKPQAIIKKLYGDGEQQMAYYALRKRLQQALTDFIVMHLRSTDTTATSTAMGWLSLGRYLFDRGSPELAWGYLRQAEQTAQEGELFDLLVPIYALQIERWHPEHGEALEIIISKWERNKILADEDERSMVACGIIRARLHNVQRQGLTINFQQTIDEVLQKYQLSDAMSERPKLLYHLLAIARSAVLVRKDYHAFAPYAEAQYAKAANRGFSPAHRYYQLGLLYMMAHVYYRSKQFAGASERLQEMERLLQEDGQPHWDAFYGKYMLLYAANEGVQGRLQSAVKALEQLQTQQDRLSVQDACNAQLNLAFGYFQQGKLSDAAKALRALHRSDAWYEQRMGIEWALKKGLSEIMFHYDLGNLDIAFSRLEKLEKNYGTLLKQDEYSNAQQFIKLIAAYFKNPLQVKSEGFEQEIEGRLTFLPKEEEDLQAMFFYAWLKSKVVGKSYYEVLLSLAHSMP